MPLLWILVVWNCLPLPATRLEKLWPRDMRTAQLLPRSQPTTVVSLLLMVTPKTLPTRTGWRRLDLLLAALAILSISYKLRYVSFGSECIKSSVFSVSVRSQSVYFIQVYNHFPNCDFVTRNFRPSQNASLSVSLLNRILLELLLAPPAETEPSHLCQHLQRSSLGPLTRFIFLLFLDYIIWFVWTYMLIKL